MKHKRNPEFPIYLMILIFAVAACSSPQHKLSSKIESLEKEMHNDSSMAPDEKKAKDAIELYIKYADKFPDDTTSASYLFKAGDLSSKINETQKAIELFGKVIHKYPNHRNAPYALFLQGFIYENQVGDPLRAKPYYEAFLKTYPDHPIAGDVSFSLENLGKSPEELIREFESKSAASDSAGATTSGMDADK